MDLLGLGASSIPTCASTTLPPRTGRSRNSIGSFSNGCIYVPRQALRSARAAFKMANNQTIERRYAEYKPTIWNDDFIQSLNSQYAAGESRINKLKEDVKAMLEEESDPLQQLEFIDNLQRLGLSYHFQGEIKRILESIYQKSHSQQSLYATALEFRLLRQHGYNAPQEVFNGFRDQSGNFNACLGEDCKAMLQLYEASFLSTEGENIMDDARTFSTNHLKEHAKAQNKLDPYLSALVSHALEQPLHWRMLRMEARWFIDVYKKNLEMNPVLLDLAKLDYNMVQAIYQEDLKHASAWWKRTGLGKELVFARDRLVENFLWPIGESYEPQNRYYRRMAAQSNTLITTIDDTFDVYGTIEELEIFTDVVDRWDINAFDELPEYMRNCTFSLFNSMNEIAFDIHREKGVNILPYTKKVWADLCKVYLVEAKWYNSKYIPTLQEYLDNAVISVGATIILFYAYVILSDSITKEGLECFVGYPNIVRWSALVLRLVNDLRTSSNELERGDVHKSLQCYMHESGASEEKAREFIWNLVDETWKKMNKECRESSPFSETCVKTGMNVARSAQFMYLHGDGHSSQDEVVQNRVSSLLVDPIIYRVKTKRDHHI